MKGYVFVVRNISGKLKGKSNSAKHLRDNNDHSFTWKVICNASNR